MENKIFTVGVGGAAGEGVKSTGIKIGEFLRDLGYEVYLSFYYPSLIRGGHNFIRLTCGGEKIWNDYLELDALVALNDETIELHKSEMREGAKIFSNQPLSEITSSLKSLLEEKKLKPAESNRELIDGNTAFGKGLQAAGLDFYIAYPMTPSTSILHYLAGEQTKSGLRVIQPENEIAVINMALGTAYAGKRVAIGTASGGFALMQEAFSLAGMAELPLVLAVSQRQAPATGVPTYSSQSDLRFVLHAGHGEFPRIILCPGDPEESFLAGAEALNLAWKFQVPVIVLLDKILSEHMMTVSLDKNISIEKGKIIDGAGENYGRYQFTEDGISPMAFPGTENAVVKVDSYEHDEKGITTDQVGDIKKMMEKRFTKRAVIQSEMQNKETVKVYGDEKSKNTIVFFGSTKSSVLEAAKYLKEPYKLVQIIWLEPFDAERVKKELGGAKHIICVEGNHGGQLASLIREKTGIEVSKKILRYDSLPFDPEELADGINKENNVT